MAKRDRKADLLYRAYKVARGRCHWCDCQTRIALHHGGERADSNLATLDHVIPRSKGGSNARSNLVLACFACNVERGDTEYHAFRAIKGLPPVTAITGTAADRLPRTGKPPLIPFNQKQHFAPTALAA